MDRDETDGASGSEGGRSEGMTLTPQGKMLGPGHLGIRENHFVKIKVPPHARSAEASDEISDMRLRIVISLFLA